MTGIKNLNRRINEWRALFRNPNNENRPKLRISETDGKTLISDTRPCAVAPEFVLTDMENAINTKCRKPIVKQKVYNYLASEETHTRDERTLESCIQGLLEKKLLIEISGSYLALANYQPKEVTSEFCKVIQQPIQRSPGTSQFQKQTAWEWFKSLDI